MVHFQDFWSFNAYQKHVKFERIDHIVLYSGYSVGMTHIIYRVIKQNEHCVEYENDHEKIGKLCNVTMTTVIFGRFIWIDFLKNGPGVETFEKNRIFLNNENFHISFQS